MTSKWLKSKKNSKETTSKKKQTLILAKKQKPKYFMPRERNKIFLSPCKLSKISAREVLEKELDGRNPHTSHPEKQTLKKDTN